MYESINGTKEKAWEADNSLCPQCEEYGYARCNACKSKMAQIVDQWYITVEYHVPVV